MNKIESFLDKIRKNNITVGVIGLGYVGLPLAQAFADKKLKVIGFEKSIVKIEQASKNGIYATTDFKKIMECDAVIICVPTPLDEFKKPNMDYIETACIDIAKNMKSQTFISLESTTYPTTTENFVKSILEKESKLKEGIDFWLCFSPERIDPGNKKFNTHNTPKIVGPMGENARKIAFAIYSKAIDNLHIVSSPRIAEMAKILENTYRLVNISLINELALLANRMEIDIWEVIEAAKTKPFGFQAFYPSAGVGGHCIPLDPFYLEHIAKQWDFDLTLINTAGQINTLMPYRVMNKISFALNYHKKALNGSTILFLGVAYKPDINDARESSSVLVMEWCTKKKANVMYYDPYIPFVKDRFGNEYKSIAKCTDKIIKDADCVVFATNHSCFDVSKIEKKAKLVVDTQNAVKSVKIQDGRVFKL
jgi:UDP-N-acetyl-D-glucosamine dehydrogenase